MKEGQPMERIKKYEGLKLGGLICIGVGLAMTLLILVSAPAGLFDRPPFPA